MRIEAVKSSRAASEGQAPAARLNDAQKCAITAPAAEILISASAGTGKTFTMTRRVVERICAGQLSLDRCLILTFTDAAAKQMKEKLAAELHSRTADARGTERQRLLRQEMLLETAQISTIHAFCLKLLQQYGQTLSQEDASDIPDPQALVASDEEREELFETALDEALMLRYREADEAYEHWFETQAHTEQAAPVPAVPPPYPPVRQLCDLYGGRRDDSGLRQLIRGLYAFLRTMPNYADWCAWAIAAYHRDARNFEQSRAARETVSIFCEAWALARPDYKTAMQILDDPALAFVKAKSAKDTAAEAVNRERRNAIRRSLEALADVAEGREGPITWDALYQLGRRISFPSISANSRNPLAQELLGCCRRAFSEIFYILNGSCATVTYAPYRRLQSRPLFTRSVADIEAELQDLEAPLSLLVELCLDCDRRYQRIKLEAKRLDYSDMEHYAYRILRQPELRTRLRGLIDEIYVDEYQDTSSLQEAILSELGTERMFAVGDLKQSIYRFRHANPDIFLRRHQRLEQAGKTKAGTQGLLIRLNENFRSEASLLRSVNRIFCPLMTQANADLDYRRFGQFVITEKASREEKASLRFLFYRDDLWENVAQQSADDASHLLEAFAERRQTDLKLSKLTPEAMAVAAAVAEKGRAGTPWEEIAVLARTNLELSRVSEALTLLAIPSERQQDRMPVESLALRSLASLIRLIENPYQDTPLLGLLLYGRVGRAMAFTRDEVEAIKVFGLRASASPTSALLSGQAPESDGAASETLAFASPFCDFCLFYMKHAAEGPVKAKLRLFYADLAKLRARCDGVSMEEGLDLLVRYLQIPERLAAGTDGEAKQRQLEAFLAWAKSLERSGENGLRRLALKLETEGLPPELPEIPAPERKAVRLTTFHRSKGMEYPYVYICGGGLRREDVGQTAFLSCSEDRGLALAGPTAWLSDPSAPPVLRVRASERRTPLQLALDAAEERADDAEYLRLLYVALTRAKRQVYIVASADMLSKAGEDFERAELSPKLSELPAYLIRRAVRHSLTETLLFACWTSASSEERKAWQLASAAAETAARAIWETRRSGRPAPPLQVETEQGDMRLLFRDVSDYAAGLLFPELFLPYDLTTANRLLQDSGGADGKDSALDVRAAGTARKTLLQNILRQTAAEPRAIPAYPYADAARHGLKYSVTELKEEAWVHAQSLFEEESATFGFGRPMGSGLAVASPALSHSRRQTEIRDLSRLLRPLSPRGQGLETGQPSEELPANELGTLLHRVLRQLRPAAYQGLDAREAASLLSQTLEHWRLAGVLTEREALALENWKPTLLRFLQSNLAASIAACDQACEAEAAAEGPRRNMIYRELPFTMALAATDLLGEQARCGRTDKILVQGVIDLWYLDAEGVTLLDYKSDRIPGTADEQRRILEERYRRQLDYYEMALRKELGRPLRRRLIWLIRDARLFEL